MDDRDRIIQELRELVAAQAAEIRALRQKVAELELALAKATKDSSNSSKPPSSDIAKPKAKQQRPGRPKKRRQGGQPGHQQHLRQPLPPERVNEIIEHPIQESDVQRLGLSLTGDFDVVQQIEMPESPVHVTEHRLMIYQDANGNLYRPDSSDLKGTLFGPRLLATIGWLKSVAHCSYSTVENWMEEVLRVPVSRGYLAKLCNETISDSLSAPYAELVSAIAHQPQLGSDETSIKDKGKKYWIWCITATAFTVFHIAQTRSRDVLEKLVGTEFAGHLNFDYFSANCSFAWNNWIKAQYCWAHLIRDIRFLAEKHPDQKTKAWAKQLLERSRRLFSAWHRREEMSAEGFHRSMLTHRDRFLELVRQPPSSKNGIEKEASNLAARFAIVEFLNQESSEVETYDRSQDYFRFMFSAGVEPTNNHSEQQIRHCVIDRKITQGTRGTAGQRYHERIWSVIATCKKQNRNFLNFLIDSIVAIRNCTPAPSLIN